VLKFKGGQQWPPFLFETDPIEELYQFSETIGAMGRAALLRRQV
jgi:hypothetical protein